MRAFKLLIFMIFTLIGCNVYADDDQPPLNMVRYVVSAEAWAKTSTALVNVSVDAILNQAGLENVHATILKRLNQIAQGDWHITNFNRYQDSSGLEKVNISAEVRLSESELPKLRDRAESISRKGEKYRVNNIQFKPSLEDMENTREQVRSDIYNKINKELARLNKVYPKEHFVVHEIDFAPQQMPVPLQRKQQMRAMVAEVASAPAVTVSDKITLQANVIFARIMKD